MRVDAFLKIKADQKSIIEKKSSSKPVGEFADDESIELLSFEHSLERAPTRTASLQMDLLLNWLADTFGLEAQDSEDRIANDLRHAPFAVYKVYDKNSPILHSWATETEELLEEVVVVVRMPRMDGAEVKHVDAFTVTMKEAYIASISIVGDFLAQPWLEGANVFPLNSAATLNQGPVERIEFRYRSIEWKFGDSPSYSTGVNNSTNA